MKRLQILRVDNDLVEKAYLQIGNNIIGRSVATGWDNDQNIKHAVTINLSPDNEMTITPVSPCYMKSTETSRWKLLKVGTTVPLKPGDVCSLLSHKCWFKVMSVPVTMEDDQEHAIKRKAKEEISCDIPDKKPCTDIGEGDNVQSRNVANNLRTDNNNIVEEKNKEITVIKQDLSNDIAVTESAEQNVQEHLASRILVIAANSTTSSVFSYSSSKVEKKIHTSNSKSQDNEPYTTGQAEISASVHVDKPNVSASVTTDRPRREKCYYGKDCYRKNPRHTVDFSHPGDSDYDVPDDRKSCPYGKRCYRTNPQHKMQYKHTATNAVSPHRKQRSRETVRASSDTLSDLEDLSADESAEESVDESEYVLSSDAESDDDFGNDWDDDFINESDDD
ncbi:Aprataxin and PNK-like factor [Dufourea novaeangliae]|uniref:Aprataxin and PNK-like factor n=1 Tax=Dufourea novaeangliae TaxID=178035 RepID=A0A154P3H7_DUFNO|nr:Aprataxin and PNK-like factor [Dufourea novaeangliae]